MICIRIVEIVQYDVHQTRGNSLNDLYQNCSNGSTLFASELWQCVSMICIRTEAMVKYDLHQNCSDGSVCFASDLCQWFSMICIRIEPMV